MGITEMRPAWKFGGPKLQREERTKHVGAFIKQPWTLYAEEKETLFMNDGKKKNIPDTDDDSTPPTYDVPKRGLQNEDVINLMYLRNRQEMFKPLDRLNAVDYGIHNKFSVLSRSLDFESGLMHREVENLDPVSHIRAIERELGNTVSPSSSALDRTKHKTEREEEQLNNELWRSMSHRRIYRLCHQYETIWKPHFRAEDVGQGGGGKDDLDGSADSFPYVEETASLVPDLSLKNILHSRHKTRSRRHPKWLEVKWFQRKWHNMYLHRRRVVRLAEEAEKVDSQSSKISVGVI